MDLGLFLFLLSTASAAHPCAEVASSRCDKDDSQLVFESQLSSEQECTDLCQVFSTTTKGCTFAAWSPEPPLGGKCLLYKEEFADYLAHCEVLSGPPDVSGCHVDDPPESSCDGVRSGECIIRGNVVETTDSVTNWEDCANFCLISSCKAWDYRSENRRCRLYDSSKKDCTTSYTPSGVNLADCGETTSSPPASTTTPPPSSSTTAPTTQPPSTTTTSSSQPNYGLVIAAGYAAGVETIGSVEKFPRNNICNIPDLPGAGRGRPTLSLLQTKDSSPQTLVICGGKAASGASAEFCLSWQKGESAWTPGFATLDPLRVGHSAVSFGDQLLLVGGEESPRTGVELPSGREFELSYDVKNACLIPQSDGFIVTGGVVGGWNYVEKYSSDGEFVEDLPSFEIGRRDHACGAFEDGEGRAVLLITGGYGFENRNGLSSTEMLWPDSDGYWTSWATGPMLPRALYGPRMANLPDNRLLLTGGSSGDLSNEVYELSLPDADSWVLVGGMEEGRKLHAVLGLDFTALCG